MTTLETAKAKWARKMSTAGAKWKAVEDYYNNPLKYLKKSKREHERKINRYIKLIEKHKRSIEWIDSRIKNLKNG